MSLFKRSSYGGSISSNPRVALVDLTEHGSDWLWAVFALMLVSALGVIVWGHMLPTGRRAFHYMTTVVLFTATIAYFAMASDLGGTPIDVEFVRDTGNTYTGPITPVTRSIWYVRYIDWTITTPMLLLTLLLGTGMPLSDIMITVFFDLLMVVTGLVGALVASQYKWGFFAFGCVAMFYVFYQLVVPARRFAYGLSEEAGKAYVLSSFILAGLWFIYPIIWAIADGGNVISTDSEMVAYGILDLLAKPCFTFFHLFALSKVPYESFALQSGHFSVGAAEAQAATGAATGYSEKSNGLHHQPAPVATEVPPAAPAPAPAAPAHGVHPNAATLHQENPEAFTQTAPPAGVVSHTTTTA